MKLPLFSESIEVTFFTAPDGDIDILYDNVCVGYIECGTGNVISTYLYPHESDKLRKKNIDLTFDNRVYFGSNA